MERQIALTDEQIHQKLREFHNDEIIKYLKEQIERILSLGKPSIQINTFTLEITHHIELNEVALDYWKEQLDRYIKYQYKELIESSAS